MGGCRVINHPATAETRRMAIRAAARMAKPAVGMRRSIAEGRSLSKREGRLEVMSGVGAEGQMGLSAHNSRNLVELIGDHLSH